MKILIGDISSNKAITIANFLKNYYPEVEIYSFDSRKYTKYIRTKFVDKHFLIKEYDIETYYTIIKKYDINYFFPVINEFIKVIISRKNNFSNSLNYVSNYNSFIILNDKSKLMKLAESLGLKIPKTYSNIKEAKPPFVIKPINKSSAKGVEYIEKKDDINKILKKYKNKKNIIVQEFVQGIGVGFSVYAKNGFIQIGYGHKRLAEYPTSGGSSVYRESFDDKRMEEIASKILKAVKWTGFAMFEFKLTNNNELYLIEVNPRIWGSINQGLQNGINYFEPILGKVNVNISKKDVKTYFSPFIYMVLLKYAFSGNLKPLYLFIKNLRSNKADVNFFDDPKGWLSLVLRKIL